MAKQTSSVLDLKITSQASTSRSPYYLCDCAGRPGSPPIGSGLSRMDALAAWFVVNREWVASLPAPIVIRINGKLWRDPFPAKR